MMNELFHAIENCGKSSNNLVITALDGEWIGEKALISNGMMVWKSCEDGFFAKHEEVACQFKESGIEMIDNCRVFYDIIGNEKQLVVCGAGHVSLPVIQLGVMMGWEVTVLEDRPSFADKARAAGATHVICESFEQGVKQLPEGIDTYFVIVTRGHHFDQICLEEIVKKEHAYIGMIGSRRRAAMVKQQLIEKGSNPEVIETVHSPIGLNIGAETPVEIGISIMAEIVEVSNKKKRTLGYSKDMICAVQNQEKYAGNKVIITIIDRKGSAPQKVGVKMMVLADGSCIGTIGGGCMEAHVRQKALQMIKNEDKDAELCHVDLTGHDREDCGMACGGVMDVLLEMVKGK